MKNKSCIFAHEYNMSKNLYIISGWIKFKAMSNKEMKEFSEELKRGLEIAEKRMLKEKALRGQDVIVCDADNNIRRIHAEEVISKNPIFQ